MMDTADDMNWTQIYLTAEQQRLIRQRAEDAGISAAEVIRRILDSALGIDGDLELRLCAVADTAGSLHDERDWGEWLGDVRAQSADERLRTLGL